MGLYNFKPRFVPYILGGTKRHTIRAERKGANDVPGRWMHLYTGLRHKGATLLFRAPCIRTEFVRITEDHRVFIGASFGHESCRPYGEGHLVPGGFVELTADERDLLAWRDGFRIDGTVMEITDPPTAPHIGCFALMMQFWSGRLPFEGLIYHWGYDRRVTK